MTSDEFGDFPDRRSFPWGPVGTSQFVEACAAYTARVGIASLTVLREIRDELKRINGVDK